MKKSTNQLDTNGKQRTPESDSKSSRSLAQPQNTIDESVPEKSQNSAKDTMKNNEEDENNRHPCHDCILVNINPNLTMHVCSVINQYMYFCGHCGESVNVKLKSFKTLSQESTQNSTQKSTQKSAQKSAQKSTHKSPQNNPASTSKSRSRSKSSDMDTSSDRKEEEETEQAQDNKGKTCPKCDESWENPSESTSNNSNNQADKRARSDHDTTEDSTEDPSLSIRRLRNSKTTVKTRKIAKMFGKPFSDKPFFDKPFFDKPFFDKPFFLLTSHIIEIFMTVDLYRQKMKSNKINRHKIAPKLTINQRIQRRR